MQSKRINTKVYCENCAFFVSEKRGPVPQALCIARASIVGDPIHTERDITGVVLPALRNKNNNCKLYQKNSLIGNREARRKYKNILRVLRSAPPPTTDSPPEAPPRKERTTASSEQLVQRAVSLSMEMMTEVLEEALSPIVDRIISLEQPNAKTERSPGPPPQGGLSDALPPFVKVRRTEDAPEQPRPVTRRAQLDQSPGEEPDVIGGPM